MTGSTAEKPDLPGLVPELLVTDLGRSLAFWRDLVGFAVLYQRGEDLFVMLKLGAAAVMLEQRQAGTRQWITGELAMPFGRGINFQIDVPAVRPILDRLNAADWPLVMEPEDAWYRAGSLDLGVRQFLVKDPDGYLLRPAQSLGTRPHGP